MSGQPGITNSDALREALRRAAREALAGGAELVLGWGPGPGPATLAPLFAASPEECDRLDFGPGAVQNLAGSLRGLAGRKVAVCVKGCDSRSVVQLLAEGLLRREELFLIGLPCAGVLDRARLAPGAAAPGDWAAGAPDELLDARCLRCRFPNPVLADVTIGPARAPRAPEGGPDADLDAFLARPALERFRHWEHELGRCLRCYACRNACPLCVCRDHCLAETRRPGWLSQSSSVREKLLFQVIHAVHTAGRCTECGECQRACPMGIPLLTMKRVLAREAEALFGHVAGTDPGQVPPLLTFRAEEPTIPDHGTEEGR
ncbi:4Fe-4S dicluster domain-containing protein [Desulfocurvus vexinensis]|uniref:4Fe-4S dicluster domain-containing protein n=1 Tax=Desulfocurvus vexinensis TaxID=399548 RepID=UPI0004AE262B|nr:4Fe-4S dicluster domain-containing protein [Desulfocurvus vexinensis]